MRSLPRAFVAVIAAGALLGSASAEAAWTHSGSGTPSAKAYAMPTGATPTTSVSGRNVTVSWSQATLGSAAVAGYVVKRYDTNGTAQTIGSGCSGTVAALTCTEAAVPAGSWRYSVTPKQSNWLGAESAQSSATTVAGPSLSLSGSTTLTSLPGTLSGSIAGFVTGQTVTFRLDNSSTGTVLSGSISPSPVPNSGGSTVSVTVPSGTANGSHTVYAIGGAGDVASASFTVTVTSTVTSAAWDFRDASAGAGEVDQSAQTAVAGDGRTFATVNMPTAFGTKYLDFDMSNPLPSGLSVTGAQFKFTYAAGATGDTACFYFEVRRASTGAVLATHGSSASPTCVTGTTLQTITTSLPEVSSSDIANDLKIRVYTRESGARPFTIDMATVTGTAAAAFTLYTDDYVDAVSSPSVTTFWGLVGAGDGSALTSLSAWNTTFATTRYLKATFPAYVPSGVTVTGATFTHSYRATASGHTACYYVEVYAGATLIGTHGSSAAPFGCNSTTSYQTTAISLPEVNTVARANSVVVRLYVDITGTGTRTTDQDLAQVAITYQ